jgi:hypothetical protein
MNSIWERPLRTHPEASRSIPSGRTQENPSSLRMEALMPVGAIRAFVQFFAPNRSNRTIHLR